MQEDRNYDLENRLIKFAGMVIKMVDDLPANYIGKHLGNQLIRSGTSPALNYGEAQSAESHADFKHKMSICLKELRESQVCLKIISSSNISPNTTIKPLLNEVSQLVAIFTSSIKTINKNHPNKKNRN